MNLLSTNGGKTSAPHRNIKQKLLVEELQNLQEVHQQSFVAFDRIVETLKKIIAYKTQHADEQRDEITIKNNFIYNLGQIEESFLSISEFIESDQALFSGTAAFRDTDKSMDGQTFKKMMNNYEQFKENINQRIHKLEKNIQILENNGFHIYTHTQKTNNVLTSLKKGTVQKYLSLAEYIKNVFQFMEKRMSTQAVFQPKLSKFLLINNKNKIQEYIKVVKLISWKEILHNQMMVKEIERIKRASNKQNQKIKITEKAINSTVKSINCLSTEISIFTHEESSKKDIKAFYNNMKQKLDSIYLPSPSLCILKLRKSKSCHTIMTRQTKKLYRSHQVQKSNSSISQMLSENFLQDSIEI